MRDLQEVFADPQTQSRDMLVELQHAAAGLVKLTGTPIKFYDTPGSVRTPMLAGFVGGDEDALEGMGKMSPIGRLGTPEEIAESIVWLCTDASSFVTGAAVTVDGGVMAT